MPTLSKLLETVVNSQLTSCFKSKQLFNNYHFWFRRNKSTADALEMFTNSCFQALNNKTLTMGIFIDFSKAFNTVNHTILFKNYVIMKLIVNNLIGLKVT